MHGCGNESIDVKAEDPPQPLHNTEGETNQRQTGPKFRAPCQCTTVGYVVLVKRSQWVKGREQEAQRQSREVEPVDL